MGLDEFKSYIKEHPALQDEVRNKKMTWQEIYENYSLSPDDPYISYKRSAKSEALKEKIVEEAKTTETVKDEGGKKEATSAEDMVKNVLGYVKKIDPDSITKYVTSIQKVLELLTTFGAGASLGSATKKNTTDPLFDRKFDDWY